MEVAGLVRIENMLCCSLCARIAWSQLLRDLDRLIARDGRDQARGRLLHHVPEGCRIRIVSLPVHSYRVFLWLGWTTSLGRYDDGTEHSGDDCHERGDKEDDPIGLHGCF